MIRQNHILAMVLVLLFDTDYWVNKLTFSSFWGDSGEQSEQCTDMIIIRHDFYYW
jgi:hypothetical protein